MKQYFLLSEESSLRTCAESTGWMTVIAESSVTIVTLWTVGEALAPTQVKRLRAGRAVRVTGTYAAKTGRTAGYTGPLITGVRPKTQQTEVFRETVQLI